MHLISGRCVCNGVSTDTALENVRIAIAHLAPPERALATCQGTGTDSEPPRRSDADTTGRAEWWGDLEGTFAGER